MRVSEAIELLRLLPADYELVYSTGSSDRNGGWWAEVTEFSRVDQEPADIREFSDPPLNCIWVE